jgi:hypothetical protein
MRSLEGQTQSGSGSLADDLTRLQGQVAEGLAAFEFGLRRKLEGQSDERPRLGRGDEVPPGYRALVDDYYRSLARTRKP